MSFRDNWDHLKAPYDTVEEFYKHVSPAEIIGLVNDHEALIEAVSAAGFGIYLTDSGKTVLKAWNPTTGIPQTLSR